MEILSSVRGASHGLIILQIVVKDVGAFMMMSWPILGTVLVRRRGRDGRRGGVRLGIVVLRDVEKAARDRFEGPELGESQTL
jgi:hypothetical protein